MVWIDLAREEKRGEKIRILCYGDSNTWGYVSGSGHQRYGNKERWTRLLSDLLGDQFEVIEEGLNSRTLIIICLTAKLKKV